MNPLTNVKNIAKLNERELKLGINEKCSWHKIYKDSPWIFIGGLDYDLTEGDIICVFSQYGEIEDINLVRDKKTGKSKGFCFLSYQGTNSTILAVDNLNGIKLCGRTIRVDHVADYRPPKESKEEEKESDVESTTIVKSERKDKETKTRHKDKRHKAVIDHNAEEISNKKHYHKSSKHNVSKEVVVDGGKVHTHHHRTKNLSSEKHRQGTSNRHFDDDDDDDDSVHSYNQRRKERKVFSSSTSSNESIKVKHKLKKEKYKDGKSYSKKRNRRYSSSEESDERTKHKNKHKRKKHKHKELRHEDSS